jgi:hypothetical protein
MKLIPLLTAILAVTSLSVLSAQSSQESLAARAKRIAEEKAREAKKAAEAKEAARKAAEAKKDESEKPLPPKGTQAYYEEIDRREKEKAKEKAQKEADERKERQRLATEEAEREREALRLKQEEEQKRRAEVAEEARQKRREEEIAREEAKAEENRIVSQDSHPRGIRVELYGARADKRTSQDGDYTLYSHKFTLFNDTNTNYGVQVRLTSPDGEPYEVGDSFTLFASNSMTLGVDKPYRFDKAEIIKALSTEEIREQNMSPAEREYRERAKAKMDSMRAARKSITYKPKVVYSKYPQLAQKEISVDNLLAFSQVPGSYGLLLDPNVKHVKLSGVETQPQSVTALKSTLQSHKAAYQSGGDFSGCANYYNTLVILSEVAPAEYGRPSDKKHISDVLTNIKQRFR